MAPRRGGSGSSSYYGYGSSSNWATEVHFDKDSLISPSNYIAGFAFDVLTLVALIAFLIWACTIRNHRGQLKGVLSALFSWLITVVLAMIPKIFYLADATVTYYYVIDLMLAEFFGFLTDCLLLFVFYNLVHGLLERLIDSGKPYAAVKIVHWVILGLVAVLSVATWGIYVAWYVEFVNSTYNFILLQDHWAKLDGARTIIVWLASLEILAWTIFATVKAGSHRFASKMSLFSLIAGSVFWFALKLMHTVIAIRYNLERRHRVPYNLDTSRSICQFFFCIGTVVGILLCCMNWRKLGGEEDTPPTSVPYGGPGQPYQTWQPYPQQYPPYPPQQLPTGQSYPQHPQPNLGQVQPQAQAEAQPQPQPQMQQH